jgi:short-subunit dehydrogenase
MRDLRGSTAILTGASRGLGPYIARALADEGLNLVLAARSAADLERVAGEVRERGVRALVVPTDVADPGARAHLLEAALREFGAVDVLVNNAGLENSGFYADSPSDEIERVVQVNLLATLLFTREVLPHMLERGRGHILNMASMAGRAPLPFAATYTATKHGIVGFTHALRTELRGSGVSASAVCPGFVDDAGMYQDMKDETGMKIPVVVGTTKPDKVARAFVKALKADRVELRVNPGPVRLVLALGVFSPSLAQLLTRLSGIVEPARALAEQRRAARRSSVHDDPGVPVGPAS